MTALPHAPWTLEGREPYGEADTRAKLIDPRLYSVGWTEEHIRREETAGGIEVIEGEARRASKGRVDYTLRIKITPSAQAVALGYIEAKAETKMPDEGLQQGMDYAAAKPKRRLLDTCDLWCVLSLPGGVFTATGAGVKTNVLFFTKGRPTKEIWYFDLSDVKVTKKQPFTRQHLAEFFKLLPSRADSEQSWTLDIAARRRKAKDEADAVRATANEPKMRLKKHQEALDTLKKVKAKPEEQEPTKQSIQKFEREIREIESKAQAIEDAAFDLKAVNPNAKSDEDTRTPAELIELIETNAREVQRLLAALRNL